MGAFNTYLYKQRWLCADIFSRCITKNYRLRLFDENHKQLFTIQHVTEPQLLLDKTDFMHSGWFYFELFEDNKLKERNKFYIPKDF